MPHAESLPSRSKVPIWKSLGHATALGMTARKARVLMIVIPPLAAGCIGGTTRCAHIFEERRVTGRTNGPEVGRADLSEDPALRAGSNGTTPLTRLRRPPEPEPAPAPDRVPRLRRVSHGAGGTDLCSIPRTL